MKSISSIGKGCFPLPNQLEIEFSGYVFRLFCTKPIPHVKNEMP